MTKKGETFSGMYYAGNKGKYLADPKEHNLGHDGKHFDRSNPKYRKIGVKND